MQIIRAVVIALLFVQEPQDPKVVYEEGLKKNNMALADAHAAIGEYLSGQGMHQWANDEYKLATQLYPDCEKALRKMGYKKEGDQWVFDPNFKLESKNKKSGKDAAKVRTEYMSRLEKMGKEQAGKWVDLGNKCTTNKMAAEAQGCYRTALELDPGNEKARKALGYEKLGKSGPWVSPFIKEVMRDMKEGLAKTTKGNPSSKQIEVEKGMGLTFTKQESKNFIVASPHLKKAELEDLIQHGECAYAAWCKIFKQTDPFGGQQMHFVVLKDKSQHERYVDLFHQGDAARKELAKKSAGTRGFPVTECYQGDQPLNSPEDFIIHATIQTLQESFAVGQSSKSHDPVWISEGMAYYFTKMMKDTALWSCVDLAGTGSGDEKPAKDAKDWPYILRTLIKDGQDVDIRGVINCTNYAELSPMEAVKSWSICDFLISEHRDKFIEFCADLRAARDNGEESFKKIFNWTLEDLDARWKLFAKQAYAGQ